MARRPAGKKSRSHANIELLQAFAGLLENIEAELTEASALDEANDIVADAWTARTKARRIALARKALETSPDCADAYVLLASQEKPGSEAELDLYRRGVAAGEAALGPDGMEECAGSFWGFLETRPYMRARVGLANSLWKRGELAEAAAEYRAMLELNPNDNQGVRYALMAVLQGMRAEDELSKLLATYPEDSAFWTYTDALASFRREGATKASAKRLKKALKSNPFVPDYLGGKKKMPRPSGYYSPGEASEAAIYAIDNAADWEATSGALDWLAGIAADVSKPRPRRTKS